MPISMTGYGAAQVQRGGQRLQLDIRSINSRFCEINLRLPRRLGALEVGLRQRLTASLLRGKVELGVRLRDESEAGARLRTDLQLARAYDEALREIAGAIGDEGAYRPDPAGIASMPAVLELLDADEAGEGVEAWSELLEEALEQALAELQHHRAVEGRRLADDIAQRLDLIAASLDAVRGRVPEEARRYRERIETRVAQLLGDEGMQKLGAERIATELLLHADRVAIDEELVRLDSHLAQFREVLEGEEGAIGKKLDFFLQEINREVNTIGSKSQDAEISAAVIAMKSEVEKIREQVQNLV